MVRFEQHQFPNSKHIRVQVLSKKIFTSDPHGKTMGKEKSK